MDLLELLLVVVCVALVVFGVVAATAILRAEPLAKIEVLRGEDTFYDPNTDSHVSFPSLTERASLSLSVVVPAFNEEARLPRMLREAVAYLEARAREKAGFAYEILVVDDGSSDQTSGLGHEWSQRCGADKVRVLTLRRNRGKGGAVRAGMMRARGERLLFADADGATRFADLEKLEEKLDELDASAAIVCGSRAHLEKESIAQRSLFRTVLMVGFHACVALFGTKSVRDTQCGFKLLTRSAALLCFSSLHIERWAFDVELLKIADSFGIPVGEVAVRWTEIDGSKLHPVLASIQMFKDLSLLWLRYATGAWKLKVVRVAE